MKVDFYVEKCNKTYTIDVKEATVKCIASMIADIRRECNLTKEEVDDIIANVLNKIFKQS